MTDRSTFQEGNTLTVLAGDELVTGRIVHLSARRLELALVQPYTLLFQLVRPKYFSRFLKGDGFLGDEGEPFARELLLKLHRAASYLQTQLPLVAEVMRSEPGIMRPFLDQMDHFVYLQTPLTPDVLRDTTLRIEQGLTPVGMVQYPMIRWQQPILAELLEVQASVLLHRWLREGPIDLRADAQTTTTSDQQKGTTP